MAYASASVNGLKVEIHDDKQLDSSSIFVFVPTLSSLSFHLYENGKKVQFVEFHEELKPYMRKPFHLMLKTLLEPPSSA